MFLETLQDHCGETVNVLLNITYKATEFQTFQGWKEFFQSEGRE